MEQQNFKSQNIGGIKNNQEANSMPEKAKGLFKFSSKYGNPIKFDTKEYGENLDLEKLEINQGIKLKEEGQIYLIQTCLKRFRHFINGPIFTDTFGKYHNNRRAWENDLHLKLKEEGKEEENKDNLEYYKTNRLGINNVYGVVGYLGILLDNIEDTTQKKELEDLREQIYSETRELVEKNEKGYLPYHELEDNQKIRLVENFSIIVKKIISILEKKHNIAEN
ncbi:MAG: hypothetical protein WCG28_02855 [bacterium]